MSWDPVRHAPLVSMEGESWPPVLSTEGALLLAYVFQLMETQWWPEERIRQSQRRQYSVLTDWVALHSPYYREKFSREAGSSLPSVLTRDELRDQIDRIRCVRVPKGHDGGMDVHTSGSTGKPVMVRKNRVLQLIFFANTMREHYWHGRHFDLPMAVIRAGFPPLDGENAMLNGWGPPVTFLHKTGPGYSLPMSTPVSLQAEWLLSKNPGYLITYPTNLEALCREFRGSGETPRSLRQVCTVGETVSRELRAECMDVLGCAIKDVYSSNEVGTVAVQCPEMSPATSDSYHIQSESVVVEVLRDDGSACEVGEKGRLVVTDLHNYSTPLIRYELGDVGAIGRPCKCGRGLPVLTGVIGRRRNMLRLPGGESRWPEVGFSLFRLHADVRRYQVVQQSLEDVELRVEVGSPLSPSSELTLSRIVQKALRHPFNVRVIVVEPGSLGSGEKWEEFVCKVPLDEGLT